MGIDENVPAKSGTRRPLTRDRVLRAAVALADRRGLRAVTMRRLGGELGVEAMSLYKQVANKDEILDGIVDLVVGEIEVPTPDSDWKEAMRRRAASARQVFLRHPWALGLMEARTEVGPAALRYLDAVLGSLRSAGFSIEMAAHAFWVLDSYVYGHVIQEISLPIAATEPGGEPGPLPEVEPERYPYLLEMGRHAAASGYDISEEFDFGLELVLGALERARREPR